MTITFRTAFASSVLIPLNPPTRPERRTSAASFPQRCFGVVPSATSDAGGGEREDAAVVLGGHPHRRGVRRFVRARTLQVDRDVRITTLEASLDQPSEPTDRLLVEGSPHAPGGGGIVPCGCTRQIGRASCRERV